MTAARQKPQPAFAHSDCLLVVRHAQSESSGPSVPLPQCACSSRPASRRSRWIVGPLFYFPPLFFPLPPPPPPPRALCAPPFLHRPFFFVAPPPPPPLPGGAFKKKRGGKKKGPDNP